MREYGSGRPVCPSLLSLYSKNVMAPRICQIMIRVTIGFARRNREEGWPVDTGENALSRVIILIMKSGAPRHHAVSVLSSEQCGNGAAMKLKIGCLRGIIAEFATGIVNSSACIGAGPISSGARKLLARNEEHRRRCCEGHDDKLGLDTHF